MDEKSLGITHWIRNFIVGITDSSKMEKQLKKLVDRSCHPLLQSIHQALHNSWTSFCIRSCRDYDAESPNHTKGCCSLTWAQIALDFSWEQLNTGHWKDVELVWREGYSVASLLKALCLAWEGDIREALVEVDKGILLGAPVLDNALQSLAAVLTREIHSQDVLSEVASSEPESIEITHRSAHVQYEQELPREDDSSGCLSDSVLAKGLEELGTRGEEQPQGSMSPDTNQVPDSSKRHKVVFKNYKPFQSEVSKMMAPNLPDDVVSDLNADESDIPLIDPTRRILVRHCPSLEEFQSKFMMTSTPVVISGAMDHWPACTSRKWRYCPCVYTN